jgi:hypothetical protein
VNRYRLRHIAVLGKAYREIASSPDGHGARGRAGSPERCSRIHAGRVRFDPKYRSGWLCLKRLKAATGRESKAAHHQGKSPIKLHVRNPPIAPPRARKTTQARHSWRTRDERCPTLGRKNGGFHLCSTRSPRFGSIRRRPLRTPAPCAVAATRGPWHPTRSEACALLSLSRRALP